MSRSTRSATATSIGTARAPSRRRDAVGAGWRSPGGVTSPSLEAAAISRPARTTGPRTVRPPSARQNGGHDQTRIRRRLGSPTAAGCRREAALPRPTEGRPGPASRRAVRRSAVGGPRHRPRAASFGAGIRPSPERVGVPECPRAARALASHRPRLIFFSFCTAIGAFSRTCATNRAIDARAAVGDWARAPRRRSGRPGQGRTGGAEPIGACGTISDPTIGAGVGLARRTRGPVLGRVRRESRAGAQSKRPLTYAGCRTLFVHEPTHRAACPELRYRGALPPCRAVGYRGRRAVCVFRRSSADLGARRLRARDHHPCRRAQRRRRRRIRDRAARDCFLRRIPPVLRNALVAAEDGSFFEHSGISVRRILVAAARRAMGCRRCGGREHDHAAARAQAVPDRRVHAGTKNQRDAPLPSDREAVHEGRDPHDVPQQDVLGTRHLRRRSGVAALLCANRSAN